MQDYEGEVPIRKNVSRGQERRRRYSYGMKSEILENIEILQKEMSSRAEAVRSVSNSSGISSDVLTKWVKSASEIRNIASCSSNSRKRGLFNRPWLIHLRRLEEELGREVRQRRLNGLKANKTWIISRARQLRKIRTLIPDQHVDHIQLSRSWYYSGFLLRQGFSIRRWSNHKKLAASQSSPAIFKFHQNLFSQFSQSPTVDTKYGFYKPSSVFNFDQVPLPFICEGDKRTVDNKGAERVWVRQPRSGYEKRQCTLHLTLCADSQALQPKPIIIFRGAGTMIMNSSETSDWDPRVSVLFQANAWVDGHTAINIAKLYLQDPVFQQDRAESRLFLCDNLDAHQNSDFCSSMEKLGKLMYFPPNVTDMIQPIDAGAGRMMKYHVALQLDKELENPAFLSKWTDGKFSARERRILITKWVGNAFDEIIKLGRVHRYFEKTGCLLRIDGQPNRINIQGLPEYRFEPQPKFIINLSSEDDVSGSESSFTDDESNFSEGDDSDVELVQGNSFPLTATPAEEKSVIILKLNEEPWLRGIMCPDRATVHGHEVPQDCIVVLIKEILDPQESLGTDNFGEQIGIGSYSYFKKSQVKILK
eukprot:CRZ06440.1 hypothetical protein [Spongospora subterranea]